MLQSLEQQEAASGELSASNEGGSVTLHVGTDSDSHQQIVLSSGTAISSSSDAMMLAANPSPALSDTSNPNTPGNRKRRKQE